MHYHSEKSTSLYHLFPKFLFLASQKQVLDKIANVLACISRYLMPAVVFKNSRVPFIAQPNEILAVQPPLIPQPDDIHSRDLDAYFIARMMEHLVPGRCRS